MKKNAFFITFVITVFLIVISVVVYSFLNMNIGITPQGTVSGIDKVSSDAKRFNVLLIGTDASKSLTDTLMLMNIDTKNGLVNITSIPRDTMVYVKGERFKINACSSLDKSTTKLDLLFSKIKEITDVPINYYVKIDYKSFRKVIDTLGGVEIDVKRNMDYEDPAQGLKIHIKKGKQVLDGFNAEGYVRFRHTYTMGDYDRVEVQKEFMKELIKQKLQPKYITKAPELLKTLFTYVESNFLMKDALAILPSINKFKAQSCVTNYVLPGVPDYVNEISYFIADEEETQKQLKEAFSTELVDRTAPSSQTSSSSSKSSSKASSK